MVLSITISQAQNPSQNVTFLSQYNPSGLPSTSGVTFNDIWGYNAPSGKEYAILGNARYILFVDVTDPQNPNEVYRFDGGGNTIWRDFKVYQNYVYAVDDQSGEGLHIFDMDKLEDGNASTNPYLNTITTEFTLAHNVYIDVPNAKLYAVGVRGSEDVEIYDLQTTPDSPQHIISLDFNDVPPTSNTNYYVHDIFVKDNILYCSHGFEGMQIWDLNAFYSAPGNPDVNNIVRMGGYSTGDYNHSSWISKNEDYIFVAEEVPSGRPMQTVSLANMGPGDQLLDIENTFQDDLLPNAPGSSTPHNPFVKGDLLFISYYEDGLKVYDISDPLNPLLHAYYDTYLDNNGNGGGPFGGGPSYNGTEGAWGTYPYLTSGNILVSDVDYGLFVLAVDPLNNGTCSDGIQNQDELGVDCGGVCTPCGSCTDGVQNQDETDVDCGGSSCPACATCFDGIQNQDESNIDCGGATCPQCNSCFDGVQNYNESGIDCGGNLCTPCDCTDMSLNLSGNIGPVVTEYLFDFVTSTPGLILNQNTRANYYAKNFLLLDKNTRVDLGAELLLDVDDCDNSSLQNR